LNAIVATAVNVAVPRIMVKQPDLPRSGSVAGYRIGIMDLIRHSGVVTTDEPAREAVVSGWWRFQQLHSGTRDERKQLEIGEPADVWAAWNAVSDQIQAGGRAAMELVVALIDAAPDSESVGNVAAGPLEDLVHAHGDDLVEQLETLARQSPIFATALHGVWLSDGAVSSSTRERLARWIR
jgi:hypothetical protein